MSTKNVSAIPSSVVNSGNGILWANPANATGTGAGTAIASLVNTFSITSNVVTFATNPQNFVVGQSVVVANMFTGTYLNGVTLVVLASGLSTTGFTANFSHADVALTYDAGTITPTTTYTSASNISYVTLSAGQHSLNINPQDGPPGISNNGPHQVGPVLFLASAVFAQTRAVSGLNGYPFGSPQASSASFPCPVPTLPPGSTVVGIYPYAIGTVYGSITSFTASWTGGSAEWTLDGTPQVYSSIGTDLSILSSLQFSNTGGPSTEEATAPGYNYGDAIGDYGAVVVYTTTGTPIPDTQLQTLSATQLGYAVPNNAFITGVQVGLAAGTTAGSGTASLTAQLTVAGSPVGSTKTISSLSGWTTPYTLGGSTDAWGTALRGADVNGASGLGVNFTGTLPSGGQINLNDLVVTLTYAVPATVAHITIGNTRPPTVGFN